MKRLFVIITLIILTTWLYLKLNPINNKISETTKVTVNTTTPQLTPGQVDVISTKYTNCSITQRASLNVPKSALTLDDRSLATCDVNGVSKVVFEVLDKPGSEGASNNIYRLWQEGDTLFALIVDQIGAGSGEGNAKIIQIKIGGYETISCFYFIPENFPGKPYEQLTTQEIDSITNKLKSNNPYCTNFKFVSHL